MGYGRRALQLLKMYYEGEIPCLNECKLPEENIEPVDDSELGLLEERIGKMVSLSSLLIYEIGIPLY